MANSKRKDITVCLAFIWTLVLGSRDPLSLSCIFFRCFHRETINSRKHVRDIVKDMRFPSIRREKAMAPTPVLLPGKSHGQRSLVACSPWRRSESDVTERLHFYFSLSCIGEGNSNPLQCSCLENPRDGGAWWAAVYVVAQSRTWLKRLSSSSSSSSISRVTRGSHKLPLNMVFWGLFPLYSFVWIASSSHITATWKTKKNEVPRSTMCTTLLTLHFRWRKISLVKKNGYIQQIKYTEASSKPGAIMVAYYPGNMNNNSFYYIELDSTQLNTNSLTLPRAKQFCRLPEQWESHQLRRSFVSWPSQCSSPVLWSCWQNFPGQILLIQGWKKWSMVKLSCLEKSFI